MNALSEIKVVPQITRKVFRKSYDIFIKPQGLNIEDLEGWVRLEKQEAEKELKAQRSLNMLISKGPLLVSIGERLWYTNKKVARALRFQTEKMSGFDFPVAHSYIGAKNKNSVVKLASPSGYSRQGITIDSFAFLA